MDSQGWVPISIIADFKRVMSDWLFCVINMLAGIYCEAFIQLSSFSSVGILHPWSFWRKLIQKQHLVSPWGDSFPENETTHFWSLSGFFSPHFTPSSPRNALKRKFLYHYNTPQYTFFSSLCITYYNNYPNVIYIRISFWYTVRYVMTYKLDVSWSLRCHDVIFTHLL